MICTPLVEGNVEVRVNEVESKAEFAKVYKERGSAQDPIGNHGLQVYGGISYDRLLPGAISDAKAKIKKSAERDRKEGMVIVFPRYYIIDIEKYAADVEDRVFNERRWKRTVEVVVRAVGYGINKSDFESHFV